MDGFESARLKMARAIDRIRVVERQVQAWEEAIHTLNLSNNLEPSPSGSEYDLVVRLEGLAAVPGSLTLAVDDALHHLRSALDHAIWQLVADNGAKQERQEFPVLTKRKLAELERAIAGTAPDVLAIVDAFQPYQQVAPNTYRNSTTWILHRLNVVSKHRSVVSVWPFSETYEFVVPEGVEGRELTMIVGGAFTASPAVLRVSNVPQDMPDPGDWIGLSRPRLWISGTDEHVGGPIVPTLQKIQRWAWKIVSALEGVRHA